MKVSIVILNYDGESLLKRNLSKVIEAAKYYTENNKNTIEIIVVDDASIDNSWEEIKNSKIKSQKYKLKFKSLRNEKNLGFSSTVNKGVKEATGEIIVLLNTDVAPMKNFLLPLTVHFEEKAVAAVGCMDKSIEGKSEVLRGRGI